MSTTITIRKELKSQLDEIGRKTESYNDIIQRIVDEHDHSQSYAVRAHAKKLLTLHEKPSQANEYHRQMLQKVANGESKSWDEVKRELLK